MITILGVLFDHWIKPYIENAIEWILAWRINLYPHWKHIFVLLSLYFFSGARTEFVVHHYFTAIFRLLLGFCIASAVAIGIGILPLTRLDVGANFLIAAIPLFGTSINDIALRAWRATFTRAKELARRHEIAQSWWKYFRPAFIGVLIRTGAALVVICGALQISAISTIKVSRASHIRRVDGDACNSSNISGSNGTQVHSNRGGKFRVHHFTFERYTDWNCNV